MKAGRRRGQSALKVEGRKVGSRRRRSKEEKGSNWGNRFMFTGREYFPELGIYDYRHPMYHPGLGRFLQTDSTGFDAGDMNLFRYCADDPVDRGDSTGLLDTSASIWNRLAKREKGSVLTIDAISAVVLLS